VLRARLPVPDAHASNSIALGVNGAPHAFAPAARSPVRAAQTIGEGARVATAYARTIGAAAGSPAFPAHMSFAIARASNFVVREAKCTGKSTFPVPFTRQEPMRFSGIVTR
jgi:hypothetical protein